MNPNDYDMESIPTCETCVWFHSSQSKATVIQEGSRPATTTMMIQGTCRFNPPTSGFGGRSAFPVVGSHEWCRVHEFAKEFKHLKAV